MSYSISPVLHNHKDKKGLQKVNIQVIYNRMKAYCPTNVKVEETNFSNGVVINGDLKKDYNTEIREKLNGIERRLLDAIRLKPILTKKELDQIVKNEQPKQTTSITDFIYDQVDQLRGKLSEGRLSHYNTIADKIKEYSPGATFGEVSLTWLQGFETWLRKQVGRNGALDVNTIQANMSLLKSVLNKAKDQKLVNRDQYEAYRAPAYQQKLPDYLTESEMEKFYNFLQAVERTAYKLAGYYFLLGCYAGYRISDMKRFDYQEMVKDGRLRLRAKKNGEIVTILIHTRLQKILDYIQDKPLDLSEGKMREYVKAMALLIGLNRKIKLHSARHSFGMLLAENGFSLEEAAELLGDSTETTKVYYRMTNKRIDQKVKERLG